MPVFGISSDRSLDDSPSGVGIGRYRLRKKLGIPTEINLFDYFIGGGEGKEVGLGSHYLSILGFLLDDIQIMAPSFYQVGMEKSLTCQDG